MTKLKLLFANIRLGNHFKIVNRIEIGDRIQLETLHFDHFNGIVEYMPVATGDSWIIKLDDGTIKYVQNFSTITKYQKI